MFLADLRDQMELYGLPSALAYLNDKMVDAKGGLRTLASNPILGQVGGGGGGGEGSSASSTNSG